MDDIGGIDKFRGGCVDALERNPTNGFDLMFTWMSTKDFWQQEQGILAYLIQMGTCMGDRIEHEKFRELAAAMSAFYCAFFLDLDRGGVHFRVTDIGVPVLTGMYGDKGGHAKSGYHIFELCYLAHIYTLMYNNPGPFTLYFAPTIPADGSLHISVSPDFLPANSIDLDNSFAEVIAKGIQKPLVVKLNKKFGVKVDLPANLGGATATVKVTFQPLIKVAPLPPSLPVSSNGKLAVVLESHFDENETVLIEKKCKERGVEYEYVSTLWGQKYLEFQGNECHDPIRVYKDIEAISNIDEYDCYFFVGSYCMDRLYYQSSPIKDTPNASPVVNLIRTLAKAKKLCATICHSLWAFMCAPEVLCGKKVTCAHNLVDHVKNAGGVVQFNCPDGEGTVPMCEDEWLLSCESPKELEKYLEMIFDKIQK